MFQIDCLIAEGQTVHLVAAASEDDIYDGATIGHLPFAFHLLIRVDDSTFRKGLPDTSGDTLGLIYRLNHTATGHLEIEMRPGAVIVAASDGDIPAAVRPTPLVLVGLVG